MVNPVNTEKMIVPKVDESASGIKGELTFDDKVVQKIIGIALEEIDGLLTVDGGFFSNIAEKLVNTDNVTSGIHAEVGKKQVAVDMDVVVEYGKDIKDIYKQMKELISEQVGKMTHLDVIEINVNVVDIKTKAEFEEEQETVQDKVTHVASSTGEYISKQADKAKKGISKGVDKADEALEPRVE